MRKTSAERLSRWRNDMLQELFTAVPTSCWYIVAVAVAITVVLVGVRILRSQKLDVHAGGVEIDIDKTPKT